MKLYIDTHLYIKSQRSPILDSYRIALMRSSQYRSELATEYTCDGRLGSLVLQSLSVSSRNLSQREHIPSVYWPHDFVSQPQANRHLSVLVHRRLYSIDRTSLSIAAPPQECRGRSPGTLPHPLVDLPIIRSPVNLARSGYERYILPPC